MATLCSEKKTSLAEMTWKTVVPSLIFAYFIFLSSMFSRLSGCLILSFRCIFEILVRFVVNFRKNAPDLAAGGIGLGRYKIIRLLIAGECIMIRHLIHGRSFFLGTHLLLYKYSFGGVLYIPVSAPMNERIRRRRLYFTFFSDADKLGLHFP